MTEEKFILDNYEQSQISNIEYQHKMLTSEMANFVALSTERFVTSQEMLHMLNRLSEYERYFLSCEPIAQYLSNAGRLAFSKKFDEILNYVQESTKIFQMKYQKMVDSEKITTDK
jgi:hypothetical protein